MLVAANLKDRTMLGFKSMGMVLCACSPDHSVVRLLEPAGAADAAAPTPAVAPGTRVWIGAARGEPVSSSVLAKKKLFETLATGVLYFVLIK